ncbi:MAG TPA: Na/Pi cotransporter family protein [Clostridiaceae bacterium]|nr:Na/Pi cotransporter family protein [Clostridiaceae bacterium]
MDFFRILTLIGGLALFLYGMDFMGNSLTSWSGKRLKTILGNLTSNRYKAVLLGAAVTAIIQSSSGTTVMVVGLVNSGIMALRDAIGVIMGANVGTTITSWILSLTGIESTNFFIRLLKPTYFAPILGIIGIVFLLFVKNDRWRNLAGIFVGFAILIFGMDTMSNAMKPLAANPDFQNLFLKFSNPILGIIAGAVLTAVIQSSSASVGILQALSATGIVTMSAAVPIILGQNIGTCVTAALSSLGAQRNAKRAAVVHLLFNLMGTLLFVVLVYGIELFVYLPFMHVIAAPVSIAIVHSIFNVSNTALLVNFIPHLERLAFIIFPETEEERQMKFDPFQVLDDRLLDTPTIALQQSQSLSNDMFRMAINLVHNAEDMLRSCDIGLYKKMKRQEANVDRYEDALGNYLLKLSALKLTDTENQQLTIMLHAIGDFERIADHGWSMVLAAKELNDKKITFSSYANAELNVQLQALNDTLEMTYQAFAENNTDKARLVEPLEETIDILNNQLKERHVQRLKAGVCSIDLGFIWADMLTAIERISDHCSNIAVLILEMEERQMGAHQYLHLVKKKSNVEFQDKVAHYADLYQLPPRPDNYPWPEFMEDSFTEDQVQTKEKRPAKDSV